MHQSEQNRRIPSLIKEGHNSILKSRGSNPFYGIADERYGNAISIKFITQLGKKRAFHYHDILSPIDCNEDDNEIVLSTTRIKIIINGKNLEKLHDYIIQHRVLFLKEPQDSFIEVEDGEVEISSIRFEMVQ